MAGNRERKLHFTVGQYRIAFVMLLVLIICLIAGVFYQVYTTTRQNILNSWKANTAQMARDVDYYLMCPMDAIRFSFGRVEKMMKNRADSADILSYLREESEVMAGMVDGNISGMYGYIGGEYLDGSGWIPPKDYEPKKRPWYTRAREAGGEITFVNPFHNLQTGTMMMSVVKCLEDGESVISMDVYLDDVQNMSERVRNSDQLEAVMVLDEDGFVVASSNEEEIGKDYRSEGGAYGRALTNGLLGKEEAAFRLEGELAKGGKHMVFSKKLKQGWYVVQVAKEDKILGVMLYQYILFGLVLGAIILILTGVFMVVTWEHREAEQYGRLAETDVMTGIRNRASGESEVSREIEILLKRSRPSPLKAGFGPMADLAALANRAASANNTAPVGGMFMIMDTDRFKSINDSCGHEVGDQVLIHIADCLRHSFRAGDIVFRLGGDEFAAFAPGISDPDGADALIEGFRQRVASFQLPQLGNKAPTVSIGITFLHPKKKETFETLYHRADEAMYQSKGAGGGRVTYN